MRDYALSLLDKSPLSPGDTPDKVAENFNLLASLAPGRVDLGIGKAPGVLPLSTHALQQSRGAAHKPDFAALAAELDRHLNERDAAPAGADEGDAFGAELRATPLPPAAPPRFLLGASTDSAALAAHLGWDFVYAAHINGASAEIARALDHYRTASGGRAPLLAVSVVVAGSASEAARLAEGFQRYRVQVGDGQPVTVGSLVQADTFVRQSGGGAHRIEPRDTFIVHGTPDTVHASLADLQRRYGVDEFVIDNPLAHAAQRIESIRLLASRFAPSEAGANRFNRGTRAAPAAS
ncbi:MsnO8 family LLM class oxidoreductase [Burkholderia sp. Bp8963]|nr:MsnO8 family LLM class oxidoreductase [Burkholderia sp. Bp8963]